MPNDVVDEFVKLLEQQYNVQKHIIIGDTKKDESKPLEMQYQHDLIALNEMAQLIKNNHPIDWKDLKISFKKATAAAKAAKAAQAVYAAYAGGGGTVMCEIAWKRVQIVEDLINNVQVKLMIYQPYEVPHTKYDDVTLLHQFQRGYEKAFHTQMKLIHGNSYASLIYNKKMKQMHDIFKDNVDGKKWEALKEYLNELNAFGVVNQMVLALICSCIVMISDCFFFFLFAGTEISAIKQSTVFQSREAQRRINRRIFATINSASRFVSAQTPMVFGRANYDSERTMEKQRSN